MSEPNESIEKKNTDAQKVARDYECNRACRLCPFPGLKCIQNQDTRDKIK